jgi:hypothetical protein
MSVKRLKLSRNRVFNDCGCHGCAQQYEQVSSWSGRQLPKLLRAPTPAMTHTRTPHQRRKTTRNARFSFYLEFLRIFGPLIEDEGITSTPNPALAQARADIARKPARPQPR